jgi:hypothetical protein
LIDIYRTFFIDLPLLNNQYRPRNAIQVMGKEDSKGTERRKTRVDPKTHFGPARASQSKVTGLCGDSSKSDPNPYHRSPLEFDLPMSFIPAEPL